MLVHIIKYEPNCSASEIAASFKKDFLPMWLFQFGNAQFPFQDGNNGIYIYSQSCKNINGTYEITGD